MWRRVDLVRTDFSEERIASIFRVSQKTAFFKNHILNADTGLERNLTDSNPVEYLQVVGKFWNELYNMEYLKQWIKAETASISRAILKNIHKSVNFANKFGSTFVENIPKI
jgi:hypothetical protein